MELGQGKALTILRDGHLHTMQDMHRYVAVRQRAVLCLLDNMPPVSQGCRAGKWACMLCVPGGYARYGWLLAGWLDKPLHYQEAWQRHADGRTGTTP